MSPRAQPSASGTTVATLAPLRFPLHGSRLIEASAGTGKTFTIAALYVRLVLGHGAANAYARPLSPREILVVTFTEAATQELRDRIRSRLAQAAACFRINAGDDISESDRAAADELLRALREEYPPQEWPACARKLQLAAEAMDEAAVSTIHAWCNRMLREHAFDSDSLFMQTLESDQRELLVEVVRDYWRSFMASLDREAVAAVRQWWSGPEALQQSIAHLVAHADLLAAAPLSPAEALRACQCERQRRLAELKAPWVRWVDELEALLDDAVAGKRVDARKLQARFYKPWLKTLRTWRDDPGILWPDLKTGWTRLTPAGLVEVWKTGTPPQHPALAAIADLTAALQDLPEARNDLLCHAARWVAQRFAVEQARRAQMGFNELLTRLDAALRAANGQRLAEIIRQQFPVALIDEFQDTDPVQYRIFDAVYRVAQNDPGSALILIGDPKQAIYAFRGADIYTYLAARRACVERLYTLKKNYRSTNAMVLATNHCFAVAENRSGGCGAFLFRSEMDNPIPFLSVEAQGRSDVLQADGMPVSALTVCCVPPNEDGKPLGKTAYRQQIAVICAGEIVRLLNLGQAGRAGFAGDTGSKRVRPADIAVLVNNRSEADTMRRALAQRGVRSVYLSDKDSVFESAEAGELQYWLAACAEPDDGRLLRSALATAILGLSWRELDILHHDEVAWEARVLQFRGYRDCWRRQGVLPMLRRLLNDFHVPERLLGPGEAGGSVAGERTLTNVLHLAELLQQASTLLDGEHALIRHLADLRRDAASPGGDARQLRLESDADLVQVITVHKSKGLEYPLVFLPFACTHRATDARDLPLKWHDDAGCLRLALAATDGLVDQADRERLGEDLRKLYVALTRARYATWLGVAPLKDLERSAFGYLLGGGEAIASDALRQALDLWRGHCPHITLIPAPAASAERLLPQASARAAGLARKSRRVVRERWWVASYSALKTVGEDVAAPSTSAADTPVEDVFLETRAAHNAAAVTAGWPASAASPTRPAASTAGLLHDFPRGAEAGTFLHDLLEWSANQGFGRVAGEPALLRDLIARRCQARAWQHWIEPLTAWLLHFLQTPLRLPALPGVPATSLVLAGTPSSLAEMEFWLAAHAVKTTTLDALVCRHTFAGATRPALQPDALNGMLKGFMDLVFEHEGRYYVADYKSNWLGPDDAAYTPAAMGAAILHARYELQYVLYLLALHRLLQARLRDYDYERHVGGAVYVFLRGVHAPSQGLHVERPPRALIEALDTLFARPRTRETP